MSYGRTKIEEQRLPPELKDRREGREYKPRKSVEDAEPKDKDQMNSTDRIRGSWSTRTKRLPHRLRTEDGRERYRLSMTSVEPVLGHIKEA